MLKDGEDWGEFDHFSSILIDIKWRQWGNWEDKGEKEDKEDKGEFSISSYFCFLLNPTLIVVLILEGYSLLSLIL